MVHPAPGNPSGTLVNGILHHCSLPNFGEADEEVLSDLEDVSGAEEFSSNINGASVRPGIVHRIDKGTSGLLVVAKVSHQVLLSTCPFLEKVAVHFCVIICGFETELRNWTNI